MAIPETQLETWSRYVESPSSKYTADSIRNALDNVRSVVKTRGREVYLQGSYKNSTNLFRDSDVDVVIELTSTFQNDLRRLSNHEIQRFHAAYGDSYYSLDQFRTDVISVLRDYYGFGAVDSGDKAIKVAGNGNRLDADVLVCVNYRVWNRFDGPGETDSSYVPGVLFYDQSDRRPVINFPKVHYDRGIEKQASTNDWFKPTVRMFKSARNRLTSKGLLRIGAAPSYFVENLLYNVENWRFGNNNQQSFEDVLKGLEAAPMSGFLCQNGQLPLFGPSPEQWDETSAKRFVAQVRNLWDNWYSI